MSVFTDSRNMMIFQCEEFLIKYDVSYGRKIKAHHSFCIKMLKVARLTRKIRCNLINCGPVLASPEGIIGFQNIRKTNVNKYYP